MSKKLSPDQIESVLRAARPLSPHDHAAFIDEVNQQLADLGDDLGDGVIHRVVRAVQRKYFDPPNLQGGPRKRHTVEVRECLVFKYLVWQRPENAGIGAKGVFPRVATVNAEAGTTK